MSVFGFYNHYQQVPLNFAYEPAMVVSPSWTLGGPLGTEYISSDPFFSPVLSDVLEAGSPPTSGLDSNGSSDQNYFPAVEDPPFTGTSGSLSPPDDDRLESDSVGNGRATAAASAATTARASSPMRLSDAKLRSASRKPKKHRGGARQTAASARETRLRAGHNLCEKNYRDRLKAYFEDLLVVLPMGGAAGDSDDDDDSPSAGENISRALQQGGAGAGGQAFSRGQVLEAARKRILELERKVDRLSSELGYHGSSPQATAAAHRRSVCVGGNAVQL